jgi:hypothetical protein
MRERDKLRICTDLWRRGWVCLERENYYLLRGLAEDTPKDQAMLIGNTVWCTRKFKDTLLRLKDIVGLDPDWHYRTYQHADRIRWMGMSYSEYLTRHGGP